MRRLPALASLAIAVAITAGCGGDSEQAGQTVTVLTTTSPPTTPTTETRPATTGTTGGPAPVSCGDAAFRGRASGSARGIQALGVDCETATTVARTAAGQTEPDYEAAGFHCLGSLGDETDRVVISYRCEHGDARITFTAR